MLTREQAALAAEALVLLVGEHEMHVKTPAGAKFYKEPIGSLIIAKPHSVSVDQKVIFAGGHYWTVPQSAAVYVAPVVDTNDEGQVAQAIKNVIVWQYPSDAAGKAHYNGVGHIITLYPDGSAVSHEYTGADMIPGWKLLSNDQQKVPVQIGGILAAWVPSDWQLYAIPNLDAVAKDSDVGVWAHEPGDSPDNWHLITKSGIAPAKLQPDVKTWIKNKSIVEVHPWEKELPHTAGPPKAGSVPQVAVPKAGSTELHASAIMADKNMLGDALNVLNASSHPTQVKQPLAKAGNALSEMDYHQINKDQLKAHPELKLGPGNKQLHHGQVKLSVLNYLAEQVAKLNAEEAAQQQAQDTKDKAAAEAAHSQTLSNLVHYFQAGGAKGPYNDEAGDIVGATKGQVEQAIQALEATSSTAIKQILAGKKNPLAQSAYWTIVKNHMAKHPEIDKSAKAKAVFIDALKEALASGHTEPAPVSDNLQAKIDEQLADAAAHLKEAGAGLPDQDKYAKIADDLVQKQGAAETADKSAIHTLIEYGVHAGHASTARNAVLAMALQDAWTQDHNYFVVEDPASGGYKLTSNLTQDPEKLSIYKVTPDHNIFHLSSTSGGQPYQQNTKFVLGIAKQWLKPPHPEGSLPAFGEEEAKYGPAKVGDPLDMPPGTFLNSAQSKQVYQAIYEVASKDDATEWNKGLGTINAMATESNASHVIAVMPGHDMWGSVAHAIVKARALKITKMYVYPTKENSGYFTTSAGPSYPTESGPWWRIETENGVLKEVRYKQDGHPATIIAVPPSIVLEHIAQYFKDKPVMGPGAAEPAVEQKDAYAWDYELGKPAKVGSIPKDAVVYFGTNQITNGNEGTQGSGGGYLDTYWFKDDKGGWHVINHQGVSPVASAPAIFDQMVDQGTLKPMGLLDVLKQAKAAGATGIEQDTNEKNAQELVGDQLDDLIAAQPKIPFANPKEPWQKIGSALVGAAKQGHAWYVYQKGTPAEPAWWTTTVHPEMSESYFKVTSDHKVSSHNVIPGEPSEDFNYDNLFIWQNVHTFLEGGELEHDANWQKIHDKVVAGHSNGGGIYTGDKAIAEALVTAYQLKQNIYAVQQSGGSWALLFDPPVPGTAGKSGSKYYKVTPDHEVTHVSSTGLTEVMPADQIVLSANQIEAQPGSAGTTILDSPIQIHVLGKQVGTAPKGSAVYHSVAGGKFVKKPDGNWDVYKISGETTIDSKLSYDGAVESGSLKPDEDTGGVVIHAGQGDKYAGLAPTGSLVYHMPSSPHDPKYVKYPDGTWHAYQVGGKVTDLPALDGDNLVKTGHLEEDSDNTFLLEKKVAPPPEVGPDLDAPAPELTPWQKLYETFKHAAIAPDSPDKTSQEDEYWGGSGSSEDRAIVFAMKQHANYVGGGNTYYKSRYAYQTPNSADWKVSYSLPSTGTKYYEVTGGENGTPLKVIYHSANPTDPEKEIPEQELLDKAGKYVVPDAVSLVVGGKLQVFHFGHYYNPKSKGTSKPHLELAAGKSVGKVVITYHDSKGVANTGKSALYAKKALENMTEYHEQPVGSVLDEAGEPQKSYLTPLQVNGPWYSIWTPGGGSANARFYKDGTGYAQSNAVAGGTKPWQDHGGSQNKSIMDALRESGDVLDEWGNSVAVPGGTDMVHLWESTGYTHPELDELTNWIEQQNGALDATHYTVVQKLSDGGANTYKLAQWLGTQGADTYAKQHDAILGLLHGYQNQPGSKAALAKLEPVYLKSMPSGVSKAEDIFTFNDDHYAAPMKVSWDPNYGVSNMTMPQLAALIKSISEQYGDGKVVGTHVSGLNSTQRKQWLLAWKKGDMVTVFNLDKQTGKVSPAHPGAPGNLGTHQVFWAPFGKGEVPAAKEIEGDWTSLNIAIPKAEVDNYLIKAGAVHPEFLSPTERRQWVVAHRNHNQDGVDEYSRYATDRFIAGGNPLGEKPQWTDNVQPAKSYDASLEQALDVKGEGTPTDYWNSDAVDDFVADHEDELKPWAEAWNDEQGYDTHSTSWKTYTSYKKAIIQKWVNNKRADILAELNKPKYHVVEPMPAGLRTGRSIIADQFGKKYVTRIEDGLPSLEADLRTQQPAITRLAGLAGFKTPNAIPVEVPGTGSGIARAYLPAEGSMVDVPVKKLTDQQVSDIAREHVLDWLLDNADGHPGNFLRMPDGTIVGGDKDAAWKNFGTWKGLELDGSADAQAKQLSSRLYTAIAQHAITKKTADQAYIDAIRVSRRIQGLPDETLKQYLDTAFENRTHFPGKYSNRLALEMAIIKRKNGVEKDFEDLWGKVYKQAGWTLPEVPQQKLGHGLHSGFSEPDFFDHVIAAKSFGVPAFFAGPHLEDSGVQVWTEKSGDNTLVRGETSVRGAPYAAMVAWAKTHQTSSEVSNNPVINNAPVPEADQWYSTVVEAGKSVSRHAADQLFEGPLTSKNLANLATLKTTLQLKLADAEAAQAAGPDSKQWGNYVAKGSWPGAYVSAAKYYLGEVDRVYDAKEKHGTFKPGDFVKWKAPPKPPESKKKAVKVTPPLQVVLKKATREMAHQGYSINATTDLLDPDDHELTLDGHTVFSYPGKAWHVTLPTGEVIEVNDGSETQTPKGQTGRVRFRALASDGSKSLERIRSTMQEMGIPMDEAEDADLELYYWRHLAGVLNDRKDRTEGKQAQVMAALKQYFNSHKMEWSSTDMGANLATLSHLPRPEELALWHDAWSKMTGPDQVTAWTAESKHLPHMSHFDWTAADVPNGRPYWYRFDVDPVWVGSRQMPSATGSHPEQDGVHWVKTGGAYSTEARIRVLGTHIGGWSSDADMSDSNGSAGVVYTRQNQESAGKHIWFSPRTLARTSNYSFNSDNFGNISLRKTQSPFDLKAATAMSGGSNETLIKDAMSLLDDVEAVRVSSATQRTQLIELLKSHGVTEIRGMPVEKRIVTGGFGDMQAAKSLNHASAPSWFDADKPYVPPTAAKITKAQSAIYTEAELEGPKSASVGGLEYLETDPDAAAPQSAVNQVFWQAGSKPSNAVALGEELKKALAYRLSNSMDSSTEQIMALGTACGLTPNTSYVGGDREQMIGTFINQWAATNNSPFIYAMQQVAHEMFGVQVADPVKVPESKQAMVAQIQAEYGDVLRDFLMNQWQATQDDFSKAGIDHVTLRRSFAWGHQVGAYGSVVAGGKPDWAKNAKVGDIIDVPPNKTLSSWAIDPQGADMFAVGDSTTVEATVPIGLILSYPRSGFGCYNESEVLGIAAPGKWKVVK